MREWVKCPICGEPDMPKKDGVTTCVNLSCPSNVGFPTSPPSEAVQSLREHAEIEEASQNDQRDKAIKEHRYVDAQVHNELAQQHNSYIRMIDYIIRNSPSATERQGGGDAG